MSQTVEEILGRVGLDTTGMQLGTRKMLEGQAAAAREYVGVWEKALSERYCAETVANDRSLAKLRALDAEKLAIQRRFFEEQAAQADIAQGSVPQNMKREGAHVGEQVLEGAAFAGGGAAVGAGAAAAMHSGRTGAMNEGRVLIDEGLRGNYKRMIASFSRFLGLIGIELVPVLVGALVAAVIDGVPFLRMKAAQAMAAAGQKDLDKRMKDEGESLHEKIGALEKTGVISKDRADEYRADLKSGKVDLVLGEVNRDAGGRSTGAVLSYFGKMNAAKAAQKKAQGELDNLGKPHGDSPTAEVQRAQDLADKTEKIDFLKQSIAAWESKHNRSAEENLELEQEKARLLQDEVDTKKDQMEIDKENADFNKRSQEAEQERQKKINELKTEQSNVQRQAAADTQREESLYPSLEQLARARVWQGGRNQGWARTEQGQLAHQILMLQKDQMHQREWGNISGANWDAGEIGRIKGILMNEGFMANDFRGEQANAHLANISAQLKNLGVTITGVSDSK